MTQEIKSKLDDRNGEVIRALYGDTTAKYEVKIDGLTHTVLSNLRTKPNDFEAYYHCTRCDPRKEKFIPKLIELPISKIKLCTTCLTDMITSISISTLMECKQGRDDDDN